MKNKKIYLFICAKYLTFEYSGIYAIAKDANWDDLINHITNLMREHSGNYFNGVNPPPRAIITCMNEISKELYDRLNQKH